MIDVEPFGAEREPCPLTEKVGVGAADAIQRETGGVWDQGVGVGTGSRRRAEVAELKLPESVRIHRMIEREEHVSDILPAAVPKFDIATAERRVPERLAGGVDRRLGGLRRGLAIHGADCLSVERETPSWRVAQPRAQRRRGGGGRPTSCAAQRQQQG